MDSNVEFINLQFYSFILLKVIIGILLVFLLNLTFFHFQPQDMDFLFRN